MTIRTRFAPSPTGFMHIGNLRTALYGCLFARANGGKFILRIEDTDRERIVSGAEDVIYRTLRLAGLRHDEGPDIGGEYGPYVQSQRCAIYKKYAASLIESGDAYYCFCAKDAASKTEDGYNRHCRTLSAAAVQKNLSDGLPYVIRQKMPMDGGTTSYDDLVFGRIEVENRLLDDQILLKSDGMPTYNFANVVDDHLMCISHVMRGSKYLSSTPKYVLLYRALGWAAPQFVHLPLIMGKNSDGSVAKLSKRHGSTGFEELLSEGYLPSGIVNYIALLGWSPKDGREIFTLSELEQLFDLSGLNRSPAVFDYQKLNWVNGEHIKRLSLEEFCAAAAPFSGLEGTPLAAKWQLIVQLLHSRVQRLGQISALTAFLHSVPPYEAELFVSPKNKSTFETSLSILKASQEALGAVTEWDAATLHNVCAQMAESRGIKFGALMWPLRIALSGLAATPGGAAEIMLIIGQKESLRRVGAGVEKLQK